MNTITSKDQISPAIIVMTEEINEKIDRCTDDGLGWVIAKILRHFIKPK